MEPLTVTYHDKTFRRYINQRIIRQSVSRMATRMNMDLKDENPFFICVLNGAFMFASDLLKQFCHPCSIGFVKLSSYDGTESSGKVKQLIGLQDDLQGRTVVILEDIVDTGTTLEILVEELKKHKPKCILVSAMLLKPEVYKKNIPINYHGIEIPNKFVIGYGLDYNGMGRNLQCVYIITQTD